MGKVISLDPQKRRIEKTLENINTLMDEIKDAASEFAEIEKRNKEKEERLKQERAKANKKVTRDYRLKD